MNPYRQHRRRLLKGRLGLVLPHEKTASTPRCTIALGATGSATKNQKSTPPDPAFEPLAQASHRPWQHGATLKLLVGAVLRPLAPSRPAASSVRGAAACIEPPPALTPASAAASPPTQAAEPQFFATLAAMRDEERIEKQESSRESGQDIGDRERWT